MRSCVLYAAAILSRRRTISAHPVINSSTVVKGVEELTSMNVDADINVIGGGGINEKPRLYKPNNDNSINSDGDKGDYFGSSIWNPSKNVSHMLHAIVGIDRYPNYLNRLNDLSDIDSLEEALEARLSDVRRHRSEIIQRRAGMKQLVRSYISNERVELYAKIDNNDFDCSELWRDHPLLSPPTTWDELRNKEVLLDQAFKVAFRSIASTRNMRQTKSNKQMDVMPTVEDIINGNAQVQLDPSLLEDYMNQEMFDVYSFPLFTNEFCDLLRQTLVELSTLAKLDEFAHLQLGRRPIDLDTIGLGWITDLMFYMFIQPMTYHLFAKTEQLVVDDDKTVLESAAPILLDWRQGYVAGYSSNPNESKGAQRQLLVPHTDDSEVTLNCCLGDAFEGGSVEFYGLRGTPEEGQLIGKVDRPNVGTAIIHSGRQLHAVSDVLSGDRYALIIWSRSWGKLRANTCPCCWLNRRHDLSCICNKRWN